MSRLGEFLWQRLTAWRSAQGLLPDPTSPTAADLALFQGPGRRFLHVGCGPARKPHVSPGLQGADWQEIRLDIDPAVSPDIVANLLDMTGVPEGTVEAVYSSHSIEHLYPHEVPMALAEFHRVLKPEGLLILTCPDLQAVCRLVAEDQLDEPAYISPAGPIAPLDILYGLRPAMAAGNLFMAHHTGFTLKTLIAACKAAGFGSVAGLRDSFALWVLACKEPVSTTVLQQRAAEHLPPHTLPVP